MNSLASIGETLRRRREERGLSLEQASFQSKVPLRLVQTLESDDYQYLPDPLYLTGLLRNYAGFLGLDPSGLDAEFQRAIHRRPPPMPATAAPRPATALPWKTARWTVAAILMAAPLLLVALFLATMRESDNVAPSPAVEPKTEIVAPAGGEAVASADRLTDGTASPASPAPVAEAPAPRAEPPAATLPAATKPAAAGASAGHVLIARAQEQTWLSVRADAQDRREVLLQAGQTARFEAEATFHVIVGNAGGVTLSLDGTPLPPLGRPGEVVRDLILPRAGPEPPSSGAAPTVVPAR
jgi:cytoskeleton protein RodZ